MCSPTAGIDIGTCSESSSKVVERQFAATRGETAVSRKFTPLTFASCPRGDCDEKRLGEILQSGYAELLPILNGVYLAWSGSSTHWIQQMTSIGSGLPYLQYARCSVGRGT
jgi:hypothetical protein